MNGYCIWSSTRFNIETTIIQCLLADLFFIICNTDITSYADYNMPYIVADNTDDLIKSLEEASAALFQCNISIKTLTNVIY